MGNTAAASQIYMGKTDPRYSSAPIKVRKSSFCQESSESATGICEAWVLPRQCLWQSVR